MNGVTTASGVYTPTAPDWDTPCTLGLRFKIVRSDNSEPIYVSDAKRYALYLVLNPVAQWA